MKGINRTGLIALACGLLSLCRTALGISSEGAEKGGGGESAHWESCVAAFRSGSYSASDLQAMVKQPSDVPAFLKNLNLVWRRNLLLQPSLFDESLLKSLFGGSSLTWHAEDWPQGDRADISALISSNAVPGMTVLIESRCWRSKANFPDGKPGVGVYLVGFLQIKELPIQTLTLKEVRNAFGPENHNEIDLGLSEDGPPLVPTYKGSVVYDDLIASNSDGVLGTKFFFKLNSVRAGVEPSKVIVDDDIVQRVDIKEAQHRIVEK